MEVRLFLRRGCNQEAGRWLQCQITGWYGLGDWSSLWSLLPCTKKGSFAGTLLWSFCTALDGQHVGSQRHASKKQTCWPRNGIAWTRRWLAKQDSTGLGQTVLAGLRDLVNFPVVANASLWANRSTLAENLAIVCGQWAMSTCQHCSADHSDA